MNYQLGEKIILIDPMIPSEEPYKDQIGSITAMSDEFDDFFEITMADSSRHYVLDVQITQLEQIA